MVRLNSSPPIAWPNVGVGIKLPTACSPAGKPGIGLSTSVFEAKFKVTDGEVFANAKSGSPGSRYYNEIVTHSLLQGGIMYKHILVPTDGSKLSEEAVASAMTFAREIGAQVTFFYAKPEHPVTLHSEVSLIDAETLDKFASLSDDQAKEFLAAAEGVAKAEGVPCNSVALICEAPYKGIIDTAKANDCDLIFMASHGRRGISGFLLGSETHKVLSHTKIPVLVYR